MLTTCSTRHTWLHRLEPRAKLIALFAIVTSVFLVTAVWGVLALSTLLAALLWRCGAPNALGRRLIYAMLAGFPLTWLIFAVPAWQSNAHLWQALAAGAQSGGVFTLRLLDIVLANLLLIGTTDPREFARSLRGWHLPAEICLMLMTVLRFLPLAGEQARRIYDVQRCRGYRMTRLWLPSAWLPLCIPLLVGALHRAEALAISLELRGFTHGLAALATPDRWRWQEYLVAGGTAAYLVVMWIVR